MSSAFKPYACACAHCRSACARSVCLPTPEQARELIRRGYASRMGVYITADGDGYVAPATQGHIGAVLPNLKVGACVFFDGANCELHDLGLKPEEGKLSGHDRPWKPILWAVLNTWQGKQFESVKAALDRQLIKE